jgi:hypothetical protein
VSIVWVGPGGDEIVAGHPPEHRKVPNVRNDSRVALSIGTSKRNAMGLNEYSARRRSCGTRSTRPATHRPSRRRERAAAVAKTLP